jgi:hypothetical protein
VLKHGLRLGCDAVVCVAVLMAGAAFAQSLQGDGPEIAVNSYTTGGQGLADVACATGGPCTVVWASDGQDGDASGIYARRYDASGTALGGAALVNTTVTGAQIYPSVCMDDVGRSNVVWSGAGTGDSSGIFARRYDSSGTPLGTAFLVNSATAGNQSDASVACFADGSFVVTWTGDGLSPGQDGSDSGVYAQRFDALGAPTGSEFLVNVGTTGAQRMNKVSAAPDGRFVVVWGDDVEGVAFANAIRARRYDATGVLESGQFLVAQAASLTYPIEASWVREPSITHDSSGGFVVAWSAGFTAYQFPYGTFGDAGRVAVRRFLANGTGAGFAFAVGQSPDGDGTYGTSVAAGDGEFAVVWDSQALPTATPSVAARHFDADAAPTGDVSIVTQTSVYSRDPSIARIDSERYLAAWTSFAPDADSGGVVARFLCRDADLDTVCSYLDPCPNDPADDGDGDGFCADVDNCPPIANASQQDTDSDDVGDPCDACPGFDDLVDADDDAVPDACDACPLDAANDADADGVCADVDNCDTDANPGQEDDDGDGPGNACDLCLVGDDAEDADSDTIPDACDVCVEPDGVFLDPDELRLVFRRVYADDDPTDDRLTLKARTPSDFPPNGPRPDVHGAHLTMATVDGTVLLDVMLPAGTFAGSGTAGWRSSGQGANWIFSDKTDAPVQGIRKLRFRGKPGIRTLIVSGRDASYPVAPNAVPARFGFAIGDVDLGEGICRELQLAESECAFDAEQTTLECRK